MLDEGKLIPNEQLEKYYSTFRSRFGPDKLKNLDGEALLNLMYNGNKDSLVYWIEFKNDDEFPSPKFGSITGGSAFKLGLFLKKETSLWTTGSSQKPLVLSIDEAFLMARRNRDQLLKGVELLEKMPANGTDVDYPQLQQEMNLFAPDISNLALGHKYFHLLFPEKLDDFHNSDYQHFHLIKLLQLPPQGEGRYIAGGRFVSIADELNIPMYHFTSLLNTRDGGTPYSYLRIGTSGDAPRNRWELMRDGNCVAIGWGDIGDLTEITNDNAGKEQIFQLLLARDPQVNRSAARRAAQQIFNFRWAITENDLVLASDGAAVLGIGRVTDDYDYTYDPSSDFPHRRPVEWLSLDEWQQPDQQPGIEGKLTTVYRMKRDANILEVEKRIYGREPIIIRPPVQPAKSPTQQLSTLPRLTGIPARIQAILERKGQVILYGPPGIGKTYWAEKAARELAARSNFRQTFEQLTDEQKALVLGTGNQPGGMVRMCSFHPAYGYEDFLEGFRPEPVNGQMHFILRDGIFKASGQLSRTS